MFRFIPTLVSLLAVNSVSGFVAPTPSYSSSQICLNASRRAFLDAGLVVTGTLVLGGPAAFADDSADDLSMPSPEEEEAKQKAAMEERLRRKAELQKKASKSGGYADSLKGEREKQKEMQKSKEDRRRAMCEELGRGC
mmetsp:Transcript_833/g.1148  ORF Transcript_833/g.1148 Transcript_833/m.1148 type:complete len:138 (+) Transcript_833:455-868(+)|eukprot:CAMPEP_0202474314 /NCGR_PEP_ID=MMETSP1360-20130828/92316_1 /ASSEMBLY_ACC=CAM_ASM_000848 /TAXON_ID=515479 /ORGANISM="Licmophora paradoxa, Strain CCMP2313" /LENGTH=137 /DNA_ID=CAMNT_0049101431 /DNA_START=454 /DNA_END=867 /DNA_ORIENTATION=+